MTVGELADRITSSEIVEWQALDRLRNKAAQEAAITARADAEAARQRQNY